MNFPPLAAENAAQVCALYAYAMDLLVSSDVHVTHAVLLRIGNDQSKGRLLDGRPVVLSLYACHPFL